LDRDAGRRWGRPHGLRDPGGRRVGAPLALHLAGTAALGGAAYVGDAGTAGAVRDAPARRVGTAGSQFAVSRPGRADGRAVRRGGAGTTGTDRLRLALCADPLATGPSDAASDGVGLYGGAGARHAEPLLAGARRRRAAR